jgi:hypothetical protein
MPVTNRTNWMSPPPPAKITVEGSAAQPASHNLIPSQVAHIFAHTLLWSENTATDICLQTALADSHVFARRVASSCISLARIVPLPQHYHHSSLVVATPTAKALRASDRTLQRQTKCSPELGLATLRGSGATVIRDASLLRANCSLPHVLKIPLNADVFELCMSLSVNSDYFLKRR